MAAAALGAAAAGYYFYAGPDAREHRKIAAKWANDMKSDVIKKAKTLKKIDREAVQNIVMNAAKTYRGMKNLDSAEVDRATKELKANWRELVKELGSDAKAARKSVQKGVKKSVKTVRKSVTRVTK